MSGKSKLLIADDNAALAAILRFNLERAGYEVQIAKNGEVAADIASREDIDLIVSDEQMPRMSGLELCQFIRGSSRNANVPFILLTAKAFELDSEELARKYQIETVIEKPFSPSSIIDFVNGVLASAT